MKKIFVFIPVLFFIKLSQAQQAVVALPAMNVIYIGLDNPINIAVEGYTYNQLTINTEGCTLEGTNPKTYLTATTSGSCFVFVTYKKENKNRIDTFTFRKKSIPKPEVMFGTIESGSCPAAPLLAQNTIRAVLPNFVFEGFYFKVISYRWKYISNSNLTICSESVSGAFISSKLKDLIAVGKKGDLIFLDSIISVSSVGDKKLLNTFQLYIEGKKIKPTQPDFLTYQKDGEDKISYLPFQPIYGCNSEPLFPPGILKLFNIHLKDTILIKEISINPNYEIHTNANKTIYEKNNYPSGKIKVEYNFEGSDTIGIAILYYENGNIKSHGKIIARTPNIYESLQLWRFIEPDTMPEFIEKFIPTDYARIGKWKGYYEDGSLALDCNFKLEGWANLKYEIDTTVFTRCGNHEVRFYSIATALKHPKNSFETALSGLCIIYDRKGKLISEEKFKD